MIWIILTSALGIMLSWFWIKQLTPLEIKIYPHKFYIWFPGLLMFISIPTFVLSILYKMFS